MDRNSQSNGGCPVILSAGRRRHGRIDGLGSFADVCLRRLLGSVVLLFVLVLSVDAEDSSTEELSLTTLRDCTSKMLRLQATVEGDAHRDQATLALCDLYVRLRSDSRYATSEMLRQDAGKIRRRLLTVSRRQSNELERLGVARPAHLSRDVEAALSARVDRLSRPSDRPGISESSASPPQVAHARGFAAGGAFDNGWQLIELIQRVVAPEFWKERGGPGSMQYFALRRVLVVSATTDIHEQIRDLLTVLSR